MSDIYGEMALVASELLAPTSQGGFGQGVITLTKPGTSTPGENEWDQPVEGEPTVYALQAAVAAVTVDQANAKYIDGTLITTADLVVMCAVPQVEIELTDTLAIDGEARTIKKIVQLPAAGVAVAFKLFVQG
jgi:hypothetical protein